MGHRFVRIYFLFKADIRYSNDLNKNENTQHVIKGFLNENKTV